jgi:endonuclease/exonuclease/phosphatase family metal-dependent hydrolase
MAIDIINTHLGLRARERRLQVDALLGADWIGASRRPLMLVGDLNAVPRSGAYRRLSSRLHDAQRLARGWPQPTFPSRLPILRIDHVFVSAGIDILRVATAKSPLARIASDHLPLIVDFHVSGSAPAGSEPAS